jgi:hypothetical protein
MSFSFKPNQAGGEAKDNGNAFSVSSSAPGSIPVGSIPLGSRIDGSHEKSLFQITLFIVCGILVFLTIALFGYQRYLISRIASEKQVLDEEDKALGSLDLEGMRALSNRIKVVNQVLSEHVSVSTAFLILEKSIERPITYTKFTLAKNSAGKGYELQLNATAPSYKAVAQQLDTLRSDAYSKDYIPTVSYDGLAADPDGNITFSLKMPIKIEGKLPETVFTTITGTGAVLPAQTATTTP